MKTDEYTIGDKCYAVIGLKIATVIITGITWKINVDNINDKFDIPNHIAEYQVSEIISENGMVSSCVSIVPRGVLFTNINDAANELSIRTTTIVK